MTQVFAHSPEAKGRVERANGTFQDRLVSELRLASASTLEEANDVLSEFMPRFNARFGVPATQAGSAYRVPDAGLDTAGVLCHKERRRVAKDNTVQYHGRVLQLFPHADRSSAYAGARVEVQERQDGSIMVSYRGMVLTPSEAPALAASLKAQANTIPEGDLPGTRTNGWMGATDLDTDSGQAAIANDLVRGLRTQASPSRTGQARDGASTQAGQTDRTATCD